VTQNHKNEYVCVILTNSLEQHHSRGLQLFRYSLVSQHFMEPEGSIPNPQELSAYPYPEPDQPHPTSTRWIPTLSNHLRLGLRSGLLPSGSCYMPRPYHPSRLHYSNNTVDSRLSAVMVGRIGADNRNQRINRSTHTQARYTRIKLTSLIFTP
jgi:hypothetical protein